MKVTLARLGLIVVLALPPLAGQAWDKDYRSNYLLGDSDSRLSARRAAIMQVQQQAIQEAGVYIQGNSVLHNNALDEKIEQVTAAIVQVEVLSEQFVVDGSGQQRLLLEARASVDESVLAERVHHLQQQNQNSAELKQLATDNQALQQKLELLLQQQQALLPLLQQPAPVRAPALPVPTQATGQSERAFWGN